MLFELIKLSLAVRAIAEKTDADSLPVAATHRERITGIDKMRAIGAIGELVAVM